MSASGSSSSSYFHGILVAVLTAGLIWVALRSGAPQDPHMPGAVATARPEIPVPAVPAEVPAVPATPAATTETVAPAADSADAWK